jgi:hypothetical protein
MLASLILAAAAAQPGPKSIPSDAGARAREIARQLPWAHDAMLELRREAGKIQDPALRAAAEAQLLAPWLPREAWARTHLDEARRRLGDPGLTLPPPDSGDFAAAPGGACEGGHHGYPGGLAVHALSGLLHARELAGVYRHVYGLKPQQDQLSLAAIWHDSMKAGTLPFRPDGSCGPEPSIAGAPAHHVLGLAAAILRHLPKDLVFVIGSARGADLAQVCGWVRAASMLATGEETTCIAKLSPEAYVFAAAAEADQPFATAAWAAYCAKAPKGWERFEALREDGNALAFYERTR